MRSSPKITITCDCGEQRKLGVRRVVHVRVRQVVVDEAGAGRRLRGDQGSSTAATGAWAGSRFGGFGLICVAVGLTRPVSLLFLIPAGMMTWFTLFRPMVRRRHWRAIQALTRRWTLSAE